MIGGISGYAVVTYAVCFKGCEGYQADVQRCLGIRVENAAIVATLLYQPIDCLQRFIGGTEQQIARYRRSVIGMTGEDKLRIQMVRVRVRLKANADAGETDIVLERRGRNVRTDVHQQVAVDDHRRSPAKVLAANPPGIRADLADTERDRHRWRGRGSEKSQLHFHHRYPCLSASTGFRRDAATACAPIVSHAMTRATAPPIRNHQRLISTL